MPDALMIYNPVAGRYPSRLLTERAANVLRQHGWKIEIETTESSQHINILSRQAVAEKKDALFIVGGDGSINYALPGLIGAQTALGVLPAGTSNVWAQDLSLPGLSWTRWMALEESARRLARGQIRRVDVGLCNQRYFLLWAGIGLDAVIVHHIEPRRRWLKNLTFFRAATTAAIEATVWHGVDLQVTAEEKEVSGRFMLAVVSNIRLYAGGLAKISPNAMLDDGLMDLWLFEGKSLADTLQQAWNLWAGHHVQSSKVHLVPFQKVSLASDTPMYLQYDGEPEIGGEDVIIEVVPQAINALIPEETSSSLFLTPLTKRLVSQL